MTDVRQGAVSCRARFRCSGSMFGSPPKSIAKESFQMKYTWIKIADAALFVIAPIGAAVVLALSAIDLGQATEQRLPAHVDAARMINAERDAANWLSYGRTYSEQRFSPLAKINADNAKQLGLAWYADLDTNRGQEATPL